MNISGRRFVFGVNKNKYFVKTEESVMKFGFVLSRYLGGFMRVGGGMMRFVFGVNKNKYFVKIEESVMIFEFVLSRYLGGFMRVGRGMMRFVFDMNECGCPIRSDKEDK